MSDTKSNASVKPVETPVDDKPATLPVKNSIMVDIDHFLNALERRTHHVEAIAAFAFEQKLTGIVKRAKDEWEALYQEFLHKTHK